MTMTIAPASEQLNIVIVGHVDHGKSTLLGRLYADTGSLPDGKLEKVRAICQQQGKEFEYAFLFDAFLEEQEQGITIDTARTFFNSHGRQYIIIDAPGHKEFLKNMISGAARAEAALLVIDALEGVQEQSKRHGYLLSLLGISQVAVVINKMDLVGYRQEVFDSIEREYRTYLEHLGVYPHQVLPVSARHGDNVAGPSTQMPWYTGPTVLETLGGFYKETAAEQKALRLPVQDVYKFDARRIVAGRITSGTVQVGDQVVFTPSNKTGIVKTIEQFNSGEPPQSATAGQSVGITLEDQIFIERGEIVSHIEGAPLAVTDFRCNVFWLGERPLQRRQSYQVRLATQQVRCEVAAIHRLVDTDDLSFLAADRVEKNQVAELTLTTKWPIAVDRYRDAQSTGRFVIVDGYDVCGGGIVIDVEHPGGQPAPAPNADERHIALAMKGRAAVLGHKAAILVVTSADRGDAALVARSLEQRLLDDGRHAYLLDPDHLASLGILATPRSSIGGIARTLMDAGMLVILAGDPHAEEDRVLVEGVPGAAHAVVVHLSPPGGHEAPSDVVVVPLGDPEAGVAAALAECRRRGILA
ncbi:MAG: GTP-binding protein [Chloroflexota bacterium]